MSNRTPVALIIRDGWGSNPNADHDAVNAVKRANTPTADRISRDYPRTLIQTDSMDVGLPDGTMGNSEVGHQNLGAGRIVDQESVRITRAVRDGKLIENDALVAACEHAKESGSKLHLFGILSDAGVHGLLEHLYGLLDVAKQQGVSPHRVFIHAFTDGRDTPPTSGKRYAEEVARQVRGDRRRPDRQRHRPVLRDGPRQPLGSRATGLRPADRPARRTPPTSPTPPPRSRIFTPTTTTPTGRAMSSSPPGRSATRASRASKAATASSSTTTVATARAS